MSELPKWPRLLVTGDPVTREQANEIIIRTHSPILWANDQEWNQQVAAAYGIPLDRHGQPIWREARDVYAELGCLDLAYLHNHQIISSWIGGCHGWCDWDGTIGCSNYNIGKWPTREEVQDDLDTIAAAWPFLTMDVQLVDVDENETVRELLAMWRVRDGRAVFVEPGELVARPTGPDLLGFVLALAVPGGTAWERGVSLSRLREALAQVRGQMPAQGQDDAR
ncbi:hypothetical protein [Actinomadura miaoliensis]|uniref:Uncharacterized protein n=1 Tax=Actinomadura miaoliensis TaxID=430685 RepID=A0ABP7X2H8_9ACTN